MDEDQALRIVDEELDAALAGVKTPVHFAAAVRRRIRTSRVSPLPEILDAIGWAAVLAMAAGVVLWIAPLVESAWRAAG